MSQRLLDIESDMAALDDLLNEVGGDVTDPRVLAAVEAWMNELDSNINEKSDNYAALIVEMEKRAEVRKSEADRMSKRAKIDNASAAFLKEKLKGVFERRGIQTLETRRFRLSIRKNGGLQSLYVHGEVPKEFTKIIPEQIVADNEKIREALKEGSLPFANLMERGTSLAIK